MNLKHQLILLISLGISVASAQGNFFNEGQVTIDHGTILKIAGDAHLDKNIQGVGQVQFIESQPQKIIGDSLTFHYLGLHKAANSVTVNKSVKIDSLMNLQGGFWLQEQDTLKLKTGAKFAGGNIISYIKTSKSAVILHYIDANATHLPLGSDNYHPLTIKENGTPDTFYVQSFNYLPQNGAVNSTSFINQHVTLLNWNIVDKNLGNNQLDLSFEWDDAQNANVFHQQFVTPIFFDTNSAILNYVAMKMCPTDVSQVNPNVITVNNVQKVGMFSIGDSLYLNNIQEINVNPNTIKTICSGDSVLISLIPAENGIWNNGFSGSQQWVNMSGLYYASYTSLDGCLIASKDTFQLIVAPLPLMPNIVRNENVLSVSSIYNSYQWFLNGNILSGENAPQMVVSTNGVYTVKVTNEEACSVLSQGFSVNNISIDETFVDNFILGPNPADKSSWIQFYLSEDLNNFQVSITDVSGRLISLNQYDLAKGAQFIEFSLPTTGVYFVILQTKEGILKSFKWISI